MNEAQSYWAPLCTLVPKLRCWVRVASRSGGTTIEGRWGQMLTMPTAGYLEALDGPVSLRDVEWVEISTKRIFGGMAGRPRQMKDIKDDVLSALGEIGLTWELREGTWSVEGVFDDEPLQIVRVMNPFRAATAKPLPAG